MDMGMSEKGLSPEWPYLKRELHGLHQGICWGTRQTHLIVVSWDVTMK